MKVLHILRQLNPGGIECWLDRLIRSWPESRRPDFHLALESSDFGLLAPGLAARGVSLHHIPPVHSHWDAARALWRLFEQQGPFQAIHCHNHYAAVFPLAMATLAKIPVRIAHSHADFRQAPQSLLRQAYRTLSRRLLPVFTSHPLAVSTAAAADLFPTVAQGFSLLPCGADLESLLKLSRQPSDTGFNLVHVGRLVPEKNHSFLFRVFAALRQKVPSARLQLAGDGPCLASLRQQAEALDIAPAVDFLGPVTQPQLLWESASVFVFPSLNEGLGLAALEAQAAGVPTVIAAHLPAELDVVSGLIRRLALDVPIDQWVDAILQQSQVAAPTAEQRRAAFARTTCSLSANIAALEKIYAAA